MIRETTTLPVVEPPGGPGQPWSRWVFGVINVVLLAAIPVLGLIGFRSLLDTRSGEFAIDPGPADAGWIAVVDSTPIAAIVDVFDGQTGGVALVVPSGEDTAGGAVVLVSGATMIDGRPLSERTPQGAVDALESVLRLELGMAMVADGEWWDSVLDGGTVEFANPDPVIGPDGRTIVAAGRVDVAARDLAAVSTRSSAFVDDPEALEFRRSTLWSALLDADGVFGDIDEVGAETIPAELALDDEPASDGVDAVRSQLALVAAGVHLVEAMPLRGGVIDVDAAEVLVRRVVAFPRGHEFGARLQVRIIDRTGANDLEAAARALGSAGFEVSQIANAVVFDDGPTQLLETADADGDELARLAELTGADSVSMAFDTESVETVTLLLGDGAVVGSAPG